MLNISLIAKDEVGVWHHFLFCLYLLRWLNLSHIWAHIILCKKPQTEKVVWKWRDDWPPGGLLWCLHELVGPTSNKHRKARTKREKDNPTTVIPNEPRTFEWTMKHQEAFDALKEALSTAPVLGYPNFSREFILEIDASLNGPGTVLSQQG